MPMAAAPVHARTLPGAATGARQLGGRQRPQRGPGLPCQLWAPPRGGPRVAPKAKQHLHSVLLGEVLKRHDLPFTLCPGPAKHWMPDELLTDRCELTCVPMALFYTKVPAQASADRLSRGKPGLEAATGGSHWRPLLYISLTRHFLTVASAAGPSVQRKPRDSLARSPHRPRQGHRVVPWAGGPGPASWIRVGSALDCSSSVEVTLRRQVTGCHRVRLSSATLLLKASRHGVEKPQGKATCRSSPKPS